MVSGVIVAGLPLPKSQPFEWYEFLDTVRCYANSFYTDACDSAPVGKQRNKAVKLMAPHIELACVTPIKQLGMTKAKAARRDRVPVLEATIDQVEKVRKAFHELPVVQDLYQYGPETPYSLAVRAASLWADQFMNRARDPKLRKEEMFEPIEELKLWQAVWRNIGHYLTAFFRTDHEEFRRVSKRRGEVVKAIDQKLKALAGESDKRSMPEASIPPAKRVRVGTTSVEQ